MPISSSEIAQRVGVSVRYLNKLVRCGLVQPSKQSRKQGSPAEWAEEDVAKVVLAVRIKRVLNRFSKVRLDASVLEDLDDRAIAVGEQFLRELDGQSKIVIPQES
ncbi:MAG: hypothetical protein V2A73_15975 [Pseudomonadota bacterium]